MFYVLTLSDVFSSTSSLDFEITGFDLGQGKQKIVRDSEEFEITEFEITASMNDWNSKGKSKVNRFKFETAGSSR